MNEDERMLAETMYNNLSREEADAAYMWGNAGESSYHESIWMECRESMKQLEKSVAKQGYMFKEGPYKVEGKVQHRTYTLVPVNSSN